MAARGRESDGGAVQKPSWREVVKRYERRRRNSEHTVPQPFRLHLEQRLERRSQFDREVNMNREAPARGARGPRGPRLGLGRPGAVPLYQQGSGAVDSRGRTILVRPLVASTMPSREQMKRRRLVSPTRYSPPSPARTPSHSQERLAPLRPPSPAPSHSQEHLEEPSVGSCREEALASCSIKALLRPGQLQALNAHGAGSAVTTTPSLLHASSSALMEGLCMRQRDDGCFVDCSLSASASSSGSSEADTHTSMCCSSSLLGARSLSSEEVSLEKNLLSSTGHMRAARSTSCTPADGVLSRERLTRVPWAMVHETSSPGSRGGLWAAHGARLCVLGCTAGLLVCVMLCYHLLFKDSAD